MATHYNDVIVSAMPSQITSVLIDCSTVCSGGDQRKHQIKAPRHYLCKGNSLRVICRWPVNSLHKGSVIRKCFHLMPSSWFLLQINPPPNSFATVVFIAWVVLNNYIKTLKWRAVADNNDIKFTNSAFITTFCFLLCWKLFQGLQFKINHH